MISKTAVGSAGNAGSLWPSISGDGRWVVFHSSADDLVEGDTNGFSDVFLYDVVNDSLHLLSSADNGGPADGASDRARISGDGSTVTFNSRASNLTSAAVVEGGLYAVSLNNPNTSGQGRTIMVAAGLAYNDRNFGSQIFMDFGDAPLSYGTALSDDGPRHLLDPQIQLGSSNLGAPDSMGLDDHSDDDGIAVNGTLVPGLPHTFDVAPTFSGTLAVWIDFDGDGSFANATERSEFEITSPGWQQISVAVPANTIEGSSYARFRFSSDAKRVANPTGAAVDGEVEDYRVRIASAPSVDQVLINGGDPQRSSVEQVRVVFDRIVDLAMVTGDPFTLRNSDTAEILTKVMNIDLLDFAAFRRNFGT